MADAAKALAVAVDGAAISRPEAPVRTICRKEQKELLAIVRERTAARDEAEAKRKAESGQRKPFNLTGTQSVRDLQLSPDEKYVFAAVVEPSTAKPTIVPNYISDTGYVEDINGRSNVETTRERRASPSSTPKPAT
ncbi:MAG: hypothetical protein WDO73_30500 [Ignavibacteriota bacterium]